VNNQTGATSKRELNMKFKINDVVRIIGDIQGWTNLTGFVKDIHGVDYIVSCGETEDDEILAMEKEIEFITIE
jgi:hypothetical protein